MDAECRPPERERPGRSAPAPASAAGRRRRPAAPRRQRRPAGAPRAPNSTSPRRRGGRRRPIAAMRARSASKASSCPARAAVSASGTRIPAPGERSRTSRWPAVSLAITPSPAFKYWRILLLIVRSLFAGESSSSASPRSWRAMAAGSLSGETRGRNSRPGAALGGQPADQDTAVVGGDLAEEDEAARLRRPRPRGEE